MPSGPLPSLDLRTNRSPISPMEQGAFKKSLHLAQASPRCAPRPIARASTLARTLGLGENSRMNYGSPPASDSGNDQAKSNDVPSNGANSCSPESLYMELHQMAERCMRGQSPGHTLQTTALVHEAYLRLAERAPTTRAERAEFLAMASKAMRHVLVDHARGRQRIKRSPPGSKEPLDQISVAYEERAIDLLNLNDVLEKLSAFDPTMAKVVEMRFFGGLAMADCAELLEIPLRTLERNWSATRAWIIAELT